MTCHGTDCEFGTLFLLLKNGHLEEVIRLGSNGVVVAVVGISRGGRVMAWCGTGSRHRRHGGGILGRGVEVGLRPHSLAGQGKSFVINAQPPMVALEGGRLHGIDGGCCRRNRLH